MLRVLTLLNSRWLKSLNLILLKHSMLHIVHVLCGWGVSANEAVGRGNPSACFNWKQLPIGFHLTVLIILLLLY